MARPRTPTTVLELRGSFKKDPQRKKERENEPVVTEPLGPPSEFLTDRAKEIWDEIVDECPDGVLNKSHRKIVDELCIAAENIQAAYRFELADEPSEEQEALFVKSRDMMIKWCVRYEKCLGLLGMTPADASRVSAPKPPKKKSRFD